MTSDCVSADSHNVLHVGTTSIRERKTPPSDHPLASSRLNVKSLQSTPKWIWRLFLRMGKSRLLVLTGCRLILCGL